MVASNHFITGSLIGASIVNPWLAIPLAVASHFVLDSMPQFGYEGASEKNRNKKHLFQYVLLLDAVMLGILVWMLTFVIDRPELIIFGLAGYSPDLYWVYTYGYKQKLGTKKATEMHWTGKFHAGIQKLESPWGLLFEIPFFIGILYALVVLTS